MSGPTAMAIGAHPDDIEFMMAGTLLLLRERGWTTHYLTVANGSCGSSKLSANEIRHRRRAESQAAARLLGATYHESLVNDLEILYELPTLRRLAAIIRGVEPTVLLIPSPQDYMEDHTNACRLAVTAAFARGMRNFKTTPSRGPVASDVTLYHAMPHGLRDSLGRLIIPGAFVNTGRVHEKKRAALAAHKSQQQWLARSQHMNEYLRTMEEFARELGRRSRCFRYAEGWRRHLHHGFCPPDADPLRDCLGRDYLPNRKYQTWLDEGF